MNNFQVEFVHNVGRINYIPPASQMYDLYFIHSPFSLKISFHSFSGFCPDIRRILNGQVIETRPNIGNSAVEFHCSGKFRLVGTPRLECIDGRWNGNLPFCESKLQLSLHSITFIKILKPRCRTRLEINPTQHFDHFVCNLDRTFYSAVNRSILTHFNHDMLHYW